MQVSILIIRAQTGKLTVIPEKQNFTELFPAYHLSILKRGLKWGKIYKEYVSNAVDTHFMIRMDIGSTVGFHGDGKLKFFEPVSGDEGITMMIHISGGSYANI